MQQLAHDGIGATRVAMQATERVSRRSFEQEAEPTGAPWAPLQPSTLRRRKPGKKLAGLLATRRWHLLGRGRWRVTNLRKPYDLFHTTGTYKMHARQDLPVQRGGMLVYGAEVHRALRDEWIGKTLRSAGVR